MRVTILKDNGETVEFVSKVPEYRVEIPGDFGTQRANSALHRIIEEKNVEIRGRDAEIKRLTARNDILSGQVERLTEGIDDIETTREYRSGEINKLQETNDRQAEMISEMEGIVAKRAEQVDTLIDSMYEKDAEIALLKQSISRQDARNLTLSSQLDEICKIAREGPKQ